MELIIGILIGAWLVFIVIFFIFKERIKHQFSTVAENKRLREKVKTLIHEKNRWMTMAVEEEEEIRLRDEAEKGKRE